MIRLGWICLFFFLVAPLVAQNPWRYFSCPSSKVLQVEQFLQEQNIPYLSFQNARVDVSDFQGVEWVPVRDLEKRLDPQDPRWDPFLHQLNSVGRPGKGGAPSEGIWYQGDDSWTKKWGFPENSPASSGPNPLFSLLSLGVFLGWLFLRKAPWGLVIGAALAGAGMVLTGIPLLLGLLVYLGFRSWAGELDQKVRWKAVGLETPPWRWKMFWPWGLALGLGGLAVPLGWMDGVKALGWTGGAGLLGGGLVLYFRFKSRNLAQMEHRLFIPVQLLREKTVTPQRRPKLMAAAAGVLAVLGYLPLSGSSGAVHLPPLPTWDDYLHHRWYQESLPYGAGEKSAPGAQVFLSAYQWKDGRIREVRQVVLQWDEAWEKRIRQGIPETGFPRLLGPQAP